MMRRAATAARSKARLTSGAPDPYGRVTEASGLFEPAVLVGDARFLRTTTLYTRTGDLFAYGSALLTAVLLIAMRRSYTMKR